MSTMLRQIALPLCLLAARSFSQAATSGMPADNQFVPYCMGPSCGAIDDSTYSGTGIGIWRFNNTTNASGQIPISLKGFKDPKTVYLIFSNGGAGSAAMPAVSSDFLPVSRPSSASPAAVELDEAAISRLKAHGKQQATNQEHALALIGARDSERIDILSLPGLVPPRPGDVPAINSSRTWNDIYDGAPIPHDTTLKAACSSPGMRNILLWVDKAAALDGATINAFKTSFCGPNGGYARVKKLLGDVWGTDTGLINADLIQDLPNLQDINIVFLQIPDDDNAYGGYFNSTNNYRKSVYPASNEALAFFVNAGGAAASPPYYISTLLHELTHMINFYQRPIVRGVLHDPWLEETTAMMTEDIVAPSENANGYSIIPKERVIPYLRRGGSISLLGWPDPPAISQAHYQMGGSLGAFLNRRYGIHLYERLIACTDKIAPVSYNCLNNTIKELQGEDLGEEFGMFAASVYATLSSEATTPPNFGFPRVRDDLYTLAAIDLSSLSAPAIATPLLNDFPALTHTYFMSSVKRGQSTLSIRSVTIPAHTTMILVAK